VTSANGLGCAGTKPRRPDGRRRRAWKRLVGQVEPLLLLASSEGGSSPPLAWNRSAISSSALLAVVAEQLEQRRRGREVRVLPEEAQHLVDALRGRALARASHVEIARWHEEAQPDQREAHPRHAPNLVLLEGDRQDEHGGLL
jgi:hypothetical protein